MGLELNRVAVTLSVVLNERPPDSYKTFIYVNSSDEYVRDDHDLDDCASVSDTAPHEPDSSVPEAIDVDIVEDTARDGAQVPDEDVNMESTEYPLVYW